ncbi:MAG: cytochrome c3 family protein [Bacteroidales bacterium]|jgi:hypothetical protein|nr:cytochrome c3 family protein [Bacteroidales bacterium]
MKPLNFRLFILFAFIALPSVVYGLKREKLSVQDSILYVSPFQDDNERCFKCHGQEKYEYTNESLGKQVKALLCSDRIVNRSEFYSANHKSFSCTDCHSEAYTKFPHPGELRMEMQYNCLDCHGGDEAFAIFSFEEIDAEYQQSVHFRLENEGFTCWKCHNPHSYKISRRNTTNLKETIQYDNNICLNCHSDFSRLQLMTESKEINLMEKHDWLPNQTSHFRSIRCIECHTKTNDSILISHFIVPKEDAIRGCNECHSKNSILMTSLYKFESKENRKDGFLNGIILNESYVIGANRNKYLNIISLSIFSIVILMIIIHILFRILKK